MLVVDKDGGERPPDEDKGPDAQGPAGDGPRLVRGMLIALCIFALSSALLLIPPVGTLLLVTAAPFFAGYFGARKAGPGCGRSDWLLIGSLPAAIWSAVEISLLLLIMGSFLGSVDLLEPIGLSVLVGLAVLNIVFCVLGARSGAASAVRER